jgi:hypothetical protein
VGYFLSPYKDQLATFIFMHPLRHILKPFLQKKGQKPINVNKQASAHCDAIVISSLLFSQITAEYE